MLSSICPDEFHLVASRDQLSDKLQFVEPPLSEKLKSCRTPKDMGVQTFLTPGPRNAVNCWRQATKLAASSGFSGVDRRMHFAVVAFQNQL
jgi:hypothetical protein